MTSGFAPPRGGPESLNGPFGRTLDAADPAAWFARPLVNEPGTTFSYDATPHLLSLMLTRLTGQSLAEKAQRELFEPLGIWRDPGCRFIWQQRTTKHATFDGPDPFGGWPDSGLPWRGDRLGHSAAAYGAHLTLREMATFGQLYLQEGLWEGRQLIPRDYVRESVRAHNAGGAPAGTPYGYLWWQLPAVPSAYMANGYGGQLIAVVPDDVVVAVACDSNYQGQTLVETHPCWIRETFLRPAILAWERRQAVG